MAQQHPSKPQSEWAVDVWNVLIRQAIDRRETIAYSDISDAVGYGTARIGKILDYIQEYCKHHNLPKLTVLAVLKGSGVPSTGMDPHTEVDYREVYQYDWKKHPVPTAEKFEDALRIEKGPNRTLKFQKIRDQIIPFSHKDEE